LDAETNGKGHYDHDEENQGVLAVLCQVLVVNDVFVLGGDVDVFQIVDEHVLNLDLALQLVIVYIQFVQIHGQLGHVPVRDPDVQVFVLFERVLVHIKLVTQHGVVDLTPLLLHLDFVPCFIL